VDFKKLPWSNVCCLAWLRLNCSLTVCCCYVKKVVISCVLPTQRLVSSGGPTATFGTNVLRLLAQGCGTAFQTFVWLLRSQRIMTICLNCTSQKNFLTLLLTLARCRLLLCSVLALSVRLPTSIMQSVLLICSGQISA